MDLCLDRHGGHRLRHLQTALSEVEVFGFSKFECAILLAIIVFVGIMVWLMFKKSGKNGDPRWGG